MRKRGLRRGSAKGRALALAAAAGLVATAACGSTDDPAGRDRAALAGFQGDLGEVMDRLPIPGLSVAVARDGEVIWAEGYGVADAATGRPATASTRYRIASMTKPLAAAVVLRLARSGALDLDAPMARYLNDPPEWAESVTVRQVMSHTSEGPEAGRRYGYSGRYNALANVAEEAAGRPFPALLDELVLEPAGMDASVPVSWLDSLGPAIDSVARPHDPVGEVSDEPLPTRTTAGNGIVSTVEELVRFVDAFAAGRLVDSAAVEEAWTPAPVAGGAGPYGLGWFVEESPAGRLVWHGGQWPSYSGLLLHVPDQRLTLAVLADAWGVSHPYYAIGTGTVLFNAIASSFLRHMVVDDELPAMPWGADPDSLALMGERLDSAGAYLWGAELFGRGLLHREAGDEGRSDSLMVAAVECCPGSLEASEELGLLFHLGRSGDPALRRIGEEAGEARLRRYPDDVVTRFNLAVAYLQGERGDRATPLLEALLDDPDAPGWLLGWAAYFRAEQLADRDPDRARTLLRGVLDRGIDESGLLGEARTLLGTLGG